MATYSPTVVPIEYAAVRAWLATQLRRVADTMASPSIVGLHFATLHAEPARYADGDVVLADGSDWNPGSGAGLYLRLSGAWVKL